MGTVARVAGALLGLVLLGGAVFALRSETMSTHTAQDPDSRLEVVIEAATRQAEAGQTVREYAWAKVLACRTEVAIADPVTELQPVGDPEDARFRFVLQPALDDTDRTQFRGCMHDWNLDHVEVEVLEMTRLPAEGDDDGAG